MALQGDLDSFALPDVLKLLAGTAKSGRLAVTGSAGNGQVWLDAGELVGGDVSTAPRAGGTEDVVFELLRFDDGAFVFDDGERLVESGARVAVDDALERAEALLAEWAEVETVVPSLDAWATLAAEVDDDGVHVDAEQWRLLAAIAGGRSADDLAGALDLGDLAVCQRLKALVDLGVVTIGDAPVLDDADAVGVADPTDAAAAADAVAATDLALLSADSAPVVLESSVDALLPEPLPGAGTSYTDDASTTGVVDGRADGETALTDPVPAPTADPTTDDGATTSAETGWGTFDPSELADARSEHLNAAPETWNDGWAGTPEPAQPLDGEEEGSATTPSAQAEDVDDETDRGSLLKFLSSVKP